ncbi:hypothetical protein BSKO_00054 [Bryopsis sp. KO-2023]|nr:hypothetical protein BSKO_00054 [Bryopsis sp. KO-2023]
MVSRLFDAHCHLQDDRYGDGLGKVIVESVESGVDLFSVNATHEADWDKVESLGQEYPNNVVPNFGLHPWWVNTRSDAWLENLRNKLIEVPAAGLGECGMDKLRQDETDLETQEAVFVAQLRLAKELDRPVSVHCVRVFERMLDLLAKEGPFPEGLVLHSWTGSADMVKEFSKINGVHFSLSGFTTRLGKTKFSTMVKQIPLDRLLLETDSPDALPKECKTKGVESELNRPINLRFILQKVAFVLEMDENALAKHVFDNTARVFKLKTTVH